MKKLLKVIAGALMIGGFIFILGTAGSADLGTISFGQMVSQCIMGLCAIGGGYALGCLAENVEFQRENDRVIIMVNERRN